MTRLSEITAAAILVLGSLRLWLWSRSRQWVVGERNGTSVIVRRRGRFDELVLAHGGSELVQSRQDRKNPLHAGRGYVDGLHVGMLLDPQPTCILFLGGGAGTAPRQFEAAYPDVSIDIVEKDPFVVAAATRYFGLRITNRISIHVADARKFVADSPATHYDLVVLDVYDAHGIPSGLAAPEFFAAIRGSMTSTGAFVMNLVRSQTLDEDAILASLKDVFSGRETRVFDAIENSIVLVAPTIPSRSELLARAARITVAPRLSEIVGRTNEVLGFDD